MKDFQGKEIVVVIGVSVFAIFGAYYLLYLPKQNEISRMQKEIRKLHKEVEVIEEMVGRVPDPKKGIQVIQERLQKLKEKATDKEQIPRIMQQLFQKTAELNIEVTSINPRNDIKATSANLPEGVSKVFFEIKIRCSYKSLVNYIDALNKLSLLFTIEDLSVVKSKVEGVSENLDVTLLLSTYVMA